MRILYLTAHLSDVDVALRALDKSPQGPVAIEACPSVRDVARALAQAPADGIVVDLTGVQGEPARWVRELRHISPDVAIVALVRAGATGPAAEALLAGADDTLVKHGEFFLQLPQVLVHSQAQRRVNARRATDAMHVLAVGDAAVALGGAARVQILAAGDEWWSAPVEKTAAARPGALLIDDTRGATAVIAAVRALRDAQRFEPVVLLTDTTDDEARSAYRRIGVAACVARADWARLPDIIEREAQTARLEDELTLLRAKEQRLRALIETIPTTVALVGADGTVQAMNLAGLTLIGAREPAQIVGRPFTLLCDPADAGGVQAFVRQVCAGTPGLVRFTGKGIDGEPRTFEFRSVPLRRDRDVSSALGVMRVVPADRLAAPPRAASGGDIEIPLDARPRTPPPATGDPTLDALRAQLETKQQAHDSLQARLAELEAQRAVSDAAWNAVQSQLERTLLLQAAHQAAADERNDEEAGARLEQQLNEKDAHLLALAEERDAAAARFDRLEAAHASAQTLLEERAALVARLQESLAAAEASRGDLEATLTQHVSRLADIEDAREQEDRRLEAALSGVSALQARLDEAAEARERLERDLADQKAAIDAATAARDAARVQLQSALGELAALRAQSEVHRSDQATLADVRQQMARLQSEAAELEQLRRDVDEAQHRAERLQQALEDALGARTDLQQQLRERDTLESRLRVEIDQARAALESSFAERTAAKDQLAQLQRQFEPLDAELTLLRQRPDHGDALRAELATWRNEADARRSEAEALRGEASRLRADAESLRARITSLETELGALAPLRADLDAATARASAVEAERDHLRDEAEGLRGEVGILRDEAEGLRGEVGILRDEAEGLRGEVGTFRNEAEALRHEASSLRADAESLRARIAGLETELAALAPLRADLDAATARASAAEAERDHLRDEAEGLRGEVGTLRDEAEGLRGEVGTLRNEAEGLRGEVGTLRNEAEGLRGEVGTRRDEAEGLRGEVGTLRGVADTLRGETETLRNEANALRGETEALRGDIDSLRARIATLDGERSTALADLRAAVDGAHAAAMALATLERERDEARARAEAMAAEVRASVDAAQAAAIDLLSSYRERDEARTATDAVAAELRAAVDGAHASSLELAALLRERDAAHADTGAVRAELQLAIDATRATTEELAAVRRERDEVRAQAEAARADLQVAIDATRAANDELAKLQHDRNDAVSELARERAALADTHQQRLAAETRFNELSARLAGVEDDLATARNNVGAIADERNLLKQSLVDLSGQRAADTAALDALRAREAQLVSELATARGTADALMGDVAALRTALEAARRDHDDVLQRAAAAETARQAEREDEARRRDETTQALAQANEYRRRVAELDAEREHMREALARADAGAQLMASRHVEERDAVQRALDELRGAFADAETRWAAQRLELEQAVASRADAHRRLSESGVIGLASTTIDGQLLRCNDALARFCGYAQATDLLTDPSGLVLPLPVDWRAFAQHLDASAAPVVVESCVQHPDGRLAWLQASATLVRNGSHAPSLEWTVVDATDRFLRIRQMKQARRLDAIRELAVSAGQEVVEQVAALARAHDADDPALRDTVRRSTARARDVAQQLVTFAQKQARMPQLLDVNETVTHLRPTLRRLTGDDVTVGVETTPGALVVSSDPAETEQWVTSLVVASRDALPAGGTLTIATRAIDLASAGTGAERRVTPVAQVSLVACGLGARPVTVPTALHDLLAHRGATLRASHDAVTNSTRVDVYFPLVRPTRPADAPFPLLRTDIATQV